MWVGTGLSVIDKKRHEFHCCGASQGAFVKDPVMRYEGGEVHAFHNLDIDNWSYFEALGLIKDLGYREYKSVKLWWKVGGGRMDKKLTCISRDSHALEIGTYALEHKCEVDLYVEHIVIYKPMLLDASTLLIGNRGGEGEKPDSGRVGGLSGVGDKNNVEGEVMEDVENGKGSSDDEDDGNSSNDNVDDVHFFDSEEEKNLGLDDGFEENHV
ncbi:hypothetical protein SESBI_45243 [Sesbania bispinosa]|nr:hypothetical protein SESBI_45243 [Sesbania bispinosa]